MLEWPGRRAFAEVLDSARAGDDASFAELWRWLHPPVVRWLSVVAPSDVDDIESEVWLSVARSLGSFTGDDGDFRGWVFTIARRRAIDWGRRRQRRPQISPLPDHEVAGAVAFSSEQVDIDEALALLRDLTADQREVLALRVIVGMSVRETAEVVHKSEGAVRILCHRGLQTLKRQLELERRAEEVGS